MTFPIDPESLSRVVGAHPPTILRPKAFFVSWHGVMTLAHSGFSKSLLNLKTQLEHHFRGIPAENEGSKWPKTTIGALRKGRSVRLAELRTLRRLCTEHSSRLPGQEAHRLSVDALDLVRYECRSLERLSSQATFLLDLHQPCEDETPEGHGAMVDSVLGQFSEGNLTDYLEKVRNEGHREHHYRSDCVGCSLVYWLPSSNPLHRRIGSFIDDVNAELPNWYAWFHPASRHVTIRAL
jgi:hypothetical protein